jgi:hypothetical protein
MLRKFKVTYRAVKRERTTEIMAFSKYDAKQRFYRTYPKYEIISIEEVSDEQR